MEQVSSLEQLTGGNEKNKLDGRRRKEAILKKAKWEQLFTGSNFVLKKYSGEPRWRRR